MGRDCRMRRGTNPDSANRLSIERGKIQPADFDRDGRQAGDG